jgi:hypothetical protein
MWQQQVVARGARTIIASSDAQQVKQAVATLDGKEEGTLDLSNDRNIKNFVQKIGDFTWSSLPATGCN